MIPKNGNIEEMKEHYYNQSIFIQYVISEDLCAPAKQRQTANLTFTLLYYKIEDTKIQSKFYFMLKQ